MQTDEPTTHQGLPGEATAPSSAPRRADRVVFGRPAPGESKEDFIRAFLVALLGEDDPRVQAKLAEEEQSDAGERPNSTEIINAADKKGDQR